MESYIKTAVKNRLIWTAILIVIFLSVLLLLQITKPQKVANCCWCYLNETKADNSGNWTYLIFRCGLTEKHMEEIKLNNMWWIDEV